MRQQEIKHGIAIQTEDGIVVGNSTTAAVNAISQVLSFPIASLSFKVIPSRIGMAIPGMMIPPLVMSRLEKTAMVLKNPWLKAPFTVSLKTCFRVTVISS